MTLALIIAALAILATGFVVIVCRTVEGGERRTWHLPAPLRTARLPRWRRYQPRHALAGGGR